MEGSRWRASLVRRTAALVLAVVLVALLIRGWPGMGAEEEEPLQRPPPPASAAQAFDAGAGDRLPSAKDGAGSRCSTALMQAFNERARVLAERQDASSQLAYALAVPFDQVPAGDRMPPSELAGMMARRQLDAQRALLRAAALAPAQPGILFVAATQCGSGAACRGVQQALLAAEPDNMAAWLMEMGWARMRNDQEGGRIAFERAAQATRYDTHADTRLQVMVDAYGGAPLPAACATEAGQAAMRRATGMEHDFGVLDQSLMIANASYALPAYNPIRRQCVAATGDAVDGARRAACLKILSRMADGDTLIERAVALDGLVQLLADAPEAMPWRERYRQYLWMREQLADTGTHSTMRPEDYALEEVDAYRAQLEAAGRWPPPADWLPTEEHARSLIQTGRSIVKPPR